MVTRHENIPTQWAAYLALLEDAKKLLEMNKDKFKTELLEQAEVLLFMFQLNFIIAIYLLIFPFLKMQ